MEKTHFSSYCNNNIARGCKYCVLGKKLVLFISGKCSRNCYYCSLSEKRKNKDEIWANERKINNPRELIEEARESRAKGAGITGGDPLLCLNRTIKYASALKKTFKKFHIHIYLPTKLVTKEKLEKLSKYVDEVRFHPEFLINEKSNVIEDIAKIKLALLFWKKENIGIELPLIPEKRFEILSFINMIKDSIGFVNLNELEISDTNFSYMTGKYKLNESGYVIKESKEAGMWILKKLKSKLKVHLCTANLKNNFQYKNRLKMHKILPNGIRTREGTVRYLAVYAKNNFERLKREIKGFVDEGKKRIIISIKEARRVFGKHKITKVEEYPTYDREEVEREDVK
jgi:pyruvate formate-lyase activating enzyme-like uncharacterized protein